MPSKTETGPFTALDATVLRRILARGRYTSLGHIPKPRIERLREAGLIFLDGKGVWRVTPAGHDFIEAHPVEIRRPKTGRRGNLMGPRFEAYCVETRIGR